MPHGYPRIHLVWFTTLHPTLHKTTCGKWISHVQTTQVITRVTCKTCLATVYGRPERKPQ